MQYGDKQVVNINIEELFEAMDFGGELITKADPNLKVSKLIEDELKVGSHYEQEYHFKKREFNYILEVIHYRDDQDLKLFGAKSDVMGAIDVNFIYQIAKLDEENSVFEYQVNLEAKKLWAKVFIKVPSSLVTKAVNRRLDNIKKLIENKKGN